LFFYFILKCITVTLEVEKSNKLIKYKPNLDFVQISNWMRKKMLENKDRT